MEGNRSSGAGAVRSGLLTGVSTAAVSASAAVLGVILSRKFGHGVKTDGFFAAYGAYLTLALVASSLRVVVLPRFVAAQAAARLTREVSTWAVGLALPLGVITAVAVFAPEHLASALTSNSLARDQAALLLPWIIPSAVAQIFGGLVASALAALDDYQWAAFGFAAGSICGVALTIGLIDHGIVAFGWGLALNGVISLLVPLIPMLRRSGLGRPDSGTLGRLGELLEGASLPVAMQGLYLVANRLASGLGAGRGTSFSYAYLIAAFLVAVTAGSSALVTTVPFARTAISPARIGRHVVAIAWLSLAPMAAAAGVFALAGESVVRRVLGESYEGAVGTQLGHLVVYLVPWMIASTIATVVYPIVFVRGRARWLPVLALTAILIHVPVELFARWAFGLAGVAVGMAVTSSFVVVGMLTSLKALRPVARGALEAVAVCGGLAAVAFGICGALLAPLPAAAGGFVLFGIALAAWRPHGLREAWGYARGLQ